MAKRSWPSGRSRGGTRTAAVRLCAAVLLATGCGGPGGDGKGEEPAPPATGKPSTGERDTGPVNRDDFNGDGHGDVLVNGWYRQPKSGGDWRNNRFVALAGPGGPRPERAVRLAERHVRPDPRLTSAPIADDRSAQLAGDLDDDGHADAVVSRPVFDKRGNETGLDQRVVWGGADGPAGVTELSRRLDRVTDLGDFDGDGALDLLTLGTGSNGYDRGKPQPATVHYGPLSRDGGAPRATASRDVGHDGWATIALTAVGDFDGDGRDDLVTRAEYDEEDVRFEDGMPQDVRDAAFYRGTGEGLAPAGDVPGITGTGPGRGGADPVAAGDFDGDGTADVLALTQDASGVGASPDGHIVVYGGEGGPGRGRAAGKVTAKITGRAAGLGTGSTLAVGDVNGDGRDDIAAQSSGEDRRVGRVEVLLSGRDGVPGSGGGGGAVAVDRYAIGLGGKPRHPGDRDFFGWDLYLADLDTDGRAELLIGTFGFNKPRKDAGYWILRGTKDGPSTTDRRFVATKDFGTG